MGKVDVELVQLDGNVNDKVTVRDDDKFLVLKHPPALDFGVEIAKEKCQVFGWHL